MFAQFENIYFKKKVGHENTFSVNKKPAERDADTPLSAHFNFATQVRVSLILYVFCFCSCII